jgi:SAM-dependent methyltransferase
VFAEHLPFPDSYFDHAVCLGALLYFDSPEAALGELRRVLKPGARVVLRTVNSSNLYTTRTGKKLDPASKNLFEMADLIRLVEAAGFQVTRSFSYGFWPPTLTDFWWYLVCVWLPFRVQDWLSELTPPARRVNNSVLAVRN